jgi:hypothetical protein
MQKGLMPGANTRRCRHRSHRGHAFARRGHHQPRAIIKAPHDPHARLRPPRLPQTRRTCLPHSLPCRPSITVNRQSITTHLPARPGPCDAKTINRRSSYACAKHTVARRPQPVTPSPGHLGQYLISLGQFPALNSRQCEAILFSAATPLLLPHSLPVCAPSHTRPRQLT